jgi:hypothetical protein
MLPRLVQTVLEHWLRNIEAIPELPQEPWCNSYVPAPTHSATCQTAETAVFPGMRYESEAWHANNTVTKHTPSMHLAP